MEDKMEYKTDVINKETGEVELSNVFAYYDEENEIYCVADELLIDDGEIRVEIAFTLTPDCKPIGLVWNSHFANRYNMLRNEVPLKQAYDEYKTALEINVRLDINKSYDNYIEANQNFIKAIKEKVKNKIRKKVK